MAPWRLVLLVIGAPALVWSLAVFLIREPQRRDAGGGSGTGSSPALSGISGREGVLAVIWGPMTPVYVMLAAGSLVDNAIGAWAPTLFIRDFHLNAAYVGLALGARLVIGFGAGVLAGGWLSDVAGRSGHFSGKLLVCLATSALILPVAWVIRRGGPRPDARRSLRRPLVRCRSRPRSPHRPHCHSGLWARCRPARRDPGGAAIEARNARLIVASLPLSRRAGPMLESCML